MADKDYVLRLENVIKKMLTPLKDIPFNLVIKSMSGKKVIPFDFKNPEHIKGLIIVLSCRLRLCFGNEAPEYEA